MRVQACNEHWMVLSGTHPCLHTRNRCQRDSGKKKLPRGGRVSKQQCAPPSRQKAAPAASRAVVSSQLVKKHFCPSFVRMPARADEVAYLFDVADSSGKSRATWPVQYRAIAPKHKPMLVFTALFKTAKCKFDRA